MATPGTRSDDLPASISPPDGDAGRSAKSGSHAEVEHPLRHPTSESWVSFASFIFAGITGLGLLVLVFGVYLIPSDLLILIGAAIMSLAAMGWVAVALVMIGIIVKRLLTFSDRPDKVSQQAKPGELPLPSPPDSTI